MKKYDVIVIGLGPAGMAAANMAIEMGLKVLAIESRQIGKDCFENQSTTQQSLLAICDENPMLTESLARINADIYHIRENKLTSVQEKADVILGQGFASFVNQDTVRVGDKEYSGKYIFIATGTHPYIPPIQGLDKIDYLTSENLFQLNKIPKSMTFIGAGTIGCEMSQAFAKMGCKCTIVQDQSYLIPTGEKEAGEMLQKSCEEMGITIHNSSFITHINQQKDGLIVVHTRDGLQIQSEKLMISAGRYYDFSSLNLEAADVQYNRKGILVDDYLRTTNKQIYAIGDCNGSYLLSKAAMHQGILAVMNTTFSSSVKKKYLKYPVPWTVFTEPQISHVGKTSKELDTDSIEYEVLETTYEIDTYDQKSTGHVWVFCSSTGQIYGVSIVGANSKEMIDEWASAMQHEINFTDLVSIMHSFPEMSLLSNHFNKTEIVDKNRSKFIKKLGRFFF